MKIYDVTMSVNSKRYEVHAFIAAETIELARECAQDRYGGNPGFEVCHLIRIGVGE
ncbi:MAG: hypothetical protein ACYDB1_01280 [Acidiferrobacteraceae bacterium]